MSAHAGFWYPGVVKSSVSIVLFFLLSAFFLTALLGALEHSRKLLGMAGGCLAAVVLIIVFLTPVELPSWRFGLGGDDDKATSTTARVAASSTTRPAVTSTSLPATTTSSAWVTTTSIAWTTTTGTTAFFTGTTTVTPYTTLHRTVTTGVTDG